MTKKENFIKCLNREPISGLVPHFELVFFLTMEVLAKVHPAHRNYYNWNQMSKTEKKAQLIDIASCYIDIAQKYNHSALFVQSNMFEYEMTRDLLETIREIAGDEYFIMLHGDPTFSLPTGDTMMEFSARMYDDEENLIAEAQKRVDSFKKAAEELCKTSGLVDGFALCSDYCFNTNPFFSPAMFSIFVSPYLYQIIKAYRDMGLYVIKHTDGNINPIVDQLVECNPHALHSLDPQGHVDLKEIKSKYGKKVCLIGNVNCGLLQTGTEEECIEDIKRSLSDGMKGYGYIFSTSNCIYTGLPLERYELMQKVWKEFGNY